MSQTIAIIAGDGIGPEVTAQAVKVLRAVGSSHNLDLNLEELDYGAERYLRDGVGLPEGEMDRFRNAVDAIYLGALGDPRVPDMRHGREILLAMRFELELYINYRPIKCLHDRFCPLKGKGTSDVDFVVFRENTEGVYVGMGGSFKKHTPDEIAINEDVNTRKGVDRIIRAAFEHARKHGCKTVTMSDKSNAMRFAGDLWQRAFWTMAKAYPEIEANHMYVDALAMELVRNPGRFEVIVTNNLFGDIVTDLGAMLQGGMGMATSGNINPEGVSLFEPVHGSAPDIAGDDKANPIAAILTAEMMLRHLGHDPAADAVQAAVVRAIADNQLTADVGGSLACSAVGDFVAGQLS